LSHFLCTNILFIVRHLSYLFKVLNVYSFNYFVFIYVCLSIHSFYLLHSCINLFNCSCINLFIWSCIIYLKYPHTCLFNCIAYLIFILCHSYCCTLFSSTPSLCFFFLSINGLFGINLNKTFFIINKGWKRGNLMYGFFRPGQLGSLMHGSWSQVVLVLKNSKINPTYSNSFVKQTWEMFKLKPHITNIQALLYRRNAT
jgi:hypothetical protein